MSKLTRRTVLTATVAASAATALSPLKPSFAAAPPAGRQNAGFYRYKVGNIECTQVTDGLAQFPMPKGFIRNASQEDINKVLAAAYLPVNTMTVPFNPLVVNTGSRLVVIDTGYGAEAYQQTKGARGQFMTNLVAAGYDPKSVDVVIVSHLHPDHVNGIKAADGGPAFPNAEILLPSLDYAFWMSDDNLKKVSGNKMMEGYFAAARKAVDGLQSRIKQYDWNKEIVPGITTIGTPGHTPGHTAFVVASGNNKLLVQSDVTNNPYLFVRRPDWHVIWDIDGDKAEETRRKFYDMAAAEKSLIAGFHFPFPSLGYVEKRGTNYELVPVTWMPTL